MVPLEVGDAEALSTFELEGRDWFERRVPPRPPGYFEPDALREILREMLEGPEAGRARFFLVRAMDGSIIGRVNLTGISEGPGGLVAEVGYRIGAAHAGQGLARAALGVAIHVAREIGLDRLRAKVPEHHVASIKVLEANGFAPTGEAPVQAELHGAPLTLVHYARDL
nr:GNAT family N-acetyltransferase [Limimaricola litoreus]